MRVGLRSDLHVTRQVTRGGPRYVVHDPVSFQNHAFDAADYRVLTAIVGGRTLAEVCRELTAVGRLRDGEEDRRSFYRFVLRLHGLGLLHLPITGGASDEGRLRHQPTPWYGFLLQWRIPLWNPDRFLQRTLRWVGWLFSAPGLLLWVALLGTAAWKCIGHFDELFADARQLLALRNLPLLWVSLIGLKALHELGHAYACRRHGAEVPEMGVQLIVLTPCAYVDAGASWKLPRVRQRVAVALAGMYFESFVAAIAALVWTGTPAGLVHDVAFDVVALAGVTTVLFNLNPLVKYDGYFVFSDLAGVFNLQQRAANQLKEWATRLLLGRPRVADPYRRSERWLYAVYGPLAFGYRVLLAFTITAVVTMRWPGAGVFLGAVFGWALILRPALQLLHWLWSSAATKDCRPRSRTVAVAAYAILPLVATLLPVSWSVVAPGLVDPALRQSVRAPASGFVAALDVRNGSRVATGARLGVLRNPELEMRRLRLAGELEAELVNLDAIELEDATAAAVHRSRVSYLRASVQEIDRRIAAMSLEAAGTGTVAIEGDEQLVGRFLKQGEELFQIQAGHGTLRVVLTEAEVSRARLVPGSVAEARWTCEPDRPVRAVVREIRPVASRFDVPEALTQLGGGALRAARAAADLVVAGEPYLHVLLEVEELPLGAQGTGLTARVRLPASVELLGTWLQREVLSFVNAWRMS
ncbi:MAG: hypothetical protein FJ265_11175 [Planctomycetes bacterium]|nr:hypothetical protein [Planctomycetota bacterium]